MHITLLLCNVNTKHGFVRHCLRYREGPTLSFGRQGMVRVNLELELLAIELQHHKLRRRITTSPSPVA